MGMDKYAVTNEVLHEELRNEEALLMQQMQSMLNDHTKTASERSNIEVRLQQIRNKITELDTKNKSE